jgi:AcrR family transcriptional regulator
MPYPPEHHEEKRRELIRIARKLFNRKGFDAVSIDDIMAEAGLTRGGFYSYFSSKSNLFALAIEDALRTPPAMSRERLECTTDLAQQMIRTYLSQAHLNEIDDCCPMVALPNDVSRSDVAVKRAFESVFRDMVGVFEKSLERELRPNRERALAMTTLCVGAMVIARALADPQLSTELRDAVLRVAFELAGWPTGDDVTERHESPVLTPHESAPAPGP